MRRGLARSRNEAVEIIAKRGVSVGGVAVVKPSTKVDETASITVEPGRRWVSRGAHKLNGAFDEFRLSAVGVRALDIGASTGGFTEVLLDRGAAGVVAIDVGRDQLAPSLKEDTRVVSMEGTNIREVDVTDLGGCFDMAVVDVSFISLTLVAPALADFVCDGGEVIALVKPQFEVQRRDLDKRGVLRDLDKRRTAVQSVVDAFSANGLGIRALMRSPVEGASGNVEFLLWSTRGANSRQVEVPG